MNRCRIGRLIAPLLFVTVFIGGAYFMALTLLERMDPPALFVAFFLGMRSMLVIIAARVASIVLARHFDAGEPVMWKWGGIVAGVDLAVPMILHALRAYSGS